MNDLYPEPHPHEKLAEDLAHALRLPFTPDISYSLTETGPGGERVLIKLNTGSQGKELYEFLKHVRKTAGLSAEQFPIELVNGAQEIIIDPEHFEFFDHLQGKSGAMLDRLKGAAPEKIPAHLKTFEHAYEDQSRLRMAEQIDDLIVQAEQIMPLAREPMIENMGRAVAGAARTEGAAIGALSHARPGFFRGSLNTIGEGLSGVARGTTRRLDTAVMFTAAAIGLGAVGYMFKGKTAKRQVANKVEADTSSPSR